ncbi:MAG TPA: ATP-binding cassette domain-containing protein, partial [bacterium]|nr:ATP-binding cassette domain-containing protein [bacterium]
MTALLEARGLAKSFPVARTLFGRPTRTVQAVVDVSLEVARGTTLGLVGESGCGKSTVGRLLLGLLPPSAGTVRFDGADLSELEGDARRTARRRMQMVFQDPFGSLNPRMRVGDAVGEPMEIHRPDLSAAERRARVDALLARVGLSAVHAARFPAEFSGGQRQRLVIARALAADPDLVVADEPVSALDVSIQAQVVNLLRDLQAERGLTYVFVSHDLKVVEHVSDAVAVMYLGRIVERASAAELFARPTHPYTQALLSAVPDPRPGR